MNTKTNTATHAGHISMMQRSYGPRFLLDPENESGAAEAAAAKAAADKAAADKETADKAAADKITADKAAADKAAADKEAADKAAADALKGLSDNEAKLLKEQMATKAKLTQANKEAADAKAALAAYGGLDPEKVKALVAAQEVADKAAKDAEKAALEKAGEFDRVKAMMAKEHKDALDAALNEGKTNKTALEAAQQTIDDLTVGSQFNTSGYVSEELVLPATVARTVYGAHFDLVDGVVVGHDKPRGAKDRTALVDASGDPLPFDGALKKLVEASPDRDRLVRTGLKPGAQSRTTAVKPGEQTRRAADEGLRGAARIAASLAQSGRPKK